MDNRVTACMRCASADAYELHRHGRSPTRLPLLDQVRGPHPAQALHSIRTEQAYFDWIRRFILIHGKLLPSTTHATRPLCASLASALDPYRRTPALGREGSVAYDGLRPVTSHGARRKPDARRRLASVMQQRSNSLEARGRPGEPTLGLEKPKCPAAARRRRLTATESKYTRDFQPYRRCASP